MVSIRRLRLCSSIRVNSRWSKRIRALSDFHRPRNKASQSREPKKASEISVSARYLRALSSGMWRATAFILECRRSGPKSGDAPRVDDEAQGRRAQVGERITRYQRQFGMLRAVEHRYILGRDNFRGADFIFVEPCR